jgi:hypothetical protein
LGLVRRAVFVVEGLCAFETVVKEKKEKRKEETAKKYAILRSLKRVASGKPEAIFLDPRRELLVTRCELKFSRRNR